MKNKIDMPTIFIAIILIGFTTFITIFYINSNSNLKNNTIPNSNIDSNVDTSINQIDSATSTEIKEIASYTTKIYDNDKNRMHNIKLACETLNGKIVEVNEEFSFNDTLGTMGAADGYKKAVGFDSYGNVIKVYGGGICQISSTLYNCLLIAKLNVTERHAHSRRVNYVPKDKDATVFSGGPDLKFINNLDSPILIKASTDGYVVTVTLETQIAKQTSL